MAGLVVLALLMAMVGHSSAAWCVCKDGVSESVLQKTLDYACGAGADCNPTHQSMPCFNPNTVRAHCSYAVNSYFQKKGQAQGSCDFSGTATVTASDPSSSGCVYPSSASTTSTTPGTTMPTSNTSTTTTPGSTSSTTPSTSTVGGSPYVTTPTGVLGPSGAGINTDVSHGGLSLQQTGRVAFLTALVFTGLVFLPA
ncbi:PLASMODESMATA CALLOSE-BINDING PROTEIN 3-like isoform X2 [Diospyros lotus]|uniref:PLASMODESMATA CALLOSE-BINDING PROTEIN 3-like isoform X2 n=1 Tax=Diospyros lotus TaxID=55363 RepID=UPI002251F003|nr:PLASMODESMATA CALLOSE-BINDING PROTEIN 3-like isoform X2 [Diospyros lotus]